MRIRRKTSRCLNCHRTLDEIYNFCPHCGQENNDHNVSFGTFLKEFFANYLSFDTKIGRSILPFFFKPGFLTNRFNEGKRASYVHPLRLYLIVSLCFFFMATLWVEQSLETSTVDTAAVNEAIAEEVPSSISTDTSAVAADSVPLADNLQMLFRIMKDESLSDQVARDSLENINIISLDTTSSFNMKLFHQARRVLRNEPDVFGAYLMQNLPIMMFFLLPFFALLLKFFYLRKDTLYVQHLIHALHIHAFAFVLFGCLITCNLVFSIPPSVEGWLNVLSFLMVIVYIFVSFVQVYRQGWFKTAIKVFLLGSVYFFMLLLFGITEAFISFLMF